jgi:hypothetical protein
VTRGTTAAGPAGLAGKGLRDRAVDPADSDARRRRSCCRSAGASNGAATAPGDGAARIRPRARGAHHGPATPATTVMPAAGSPPGRGRRRAGRSRWRTQPTARPYARRRPVRSGHSARRGEQDATRPERAENGRGSSRARDRRRTARRRHPQPRVRQELGRGGHDAHVPDLGLGSRGGIRCPGADPDSAVISRGRRGATPARPVIEPGQRRVHRERIGRSATVSAFCTARAIRMSSLATEPRHLRRPHRSPGAEQPRSPAATPASSRGFVESAS